MDIEDRIRPAIKRDAQNIHVSREIRDKILESINKKQKNGYHKKIIVTIGVYGIFLLGINSAVGLANGQNIFNVIMHWTHISNGNNFMTGYSLIPSNTDEVSTQNVSQGSDISTSEKSSPVTVNPNTPVRAKRITGPNTTEHSFTDTNYGKELNDFLGTEHFPQLNMSDLKVNFVNATIVDKENQKFDLLVWADVSGSEREKVNLMLYHNQEGTIEFNGGSTSEIKKVVTVNGQNATFISYTNGEVEQNNITWNRGPWIIVLTGSNLPEDKLLQIAQDVDKKAQLNN